MAGYSFRTIIWERLLDPSIAISAGILDGVGSVHKFGFNPDLTANTPADVWDYDEADLYTFTTTAQPYYLSSSNASDTATITAELLDEDWMPFTVTTTLTGRTAVQIGTKNWLRINRMYNSSGVDLLGNVYCFESDTLDAGVPETPAKVKSFIAIGKGQTLQGIYSQSADRHGFVRRYDVSVSGKVAASIECSGRTRVDGGVFRVQQEFAVSSTGSSQYIRDFGGLVLMFPPKTDYRMLCNSSSSLAKVSLNFDLFLIESAKLEM